MQATTPKQVTRTTPEGFIIEIATDSVIGWKCFGCSTASVDKSIETVEHMATYIAAMQDSHYGCNL